VTIVEITEGLFLLEMLPLSGAALAGWVRWPKLSWAMRWLSIYVTLVLLIEVLAKLHLYVWTDSDNVYLMHIYSPLEFILVSLFYLRVLPLTSEGKKWFRYFIIFLGVLLVAYSVFHLTVNTGDQVFRYELLSKAVVNAFLIVYASIFIIQSLLNPGHFLDRASSLFVVNAAIMLYFAGTFVIFITLHYLMESELGQTVYFWLINVLLAFILHTSILITLWKKPSSS